VIVVQYIKKRYRHRCLVVVKVTQKRIIVLVKRNVNPIGINTPTTYRNIAAKGRKEA